MEEVSNGEPTANNYRIKIFGVGGAGCKIVDLLRINKKFSAEYFFVDDPNELGDYAGSTCINVEAEPHEFKKDIDRAVYNAGLVIIVAGIGGFIGAGASVAIAETVKENKIPTVAVVSSPFSFEGKNRNLNAEQSLNELRKIGIPTVVAPCENINSILPETAAMSRAIKLAQATVLNALNTLLMPITTPLAVNLDFYETVSLLRKSGNIYFGYGEGSGKERVNESVKFALNCPMSESPFENITGVILYIEGGDDLEFDEISDVAALVRAETDGSANIMLALNTDSELTGKLRVSVLATKQALRTEEQ